MLNTPRNPLVLYRICHLTSASMDEYLQKHNLPSKDDLFKEFGIFEPDEDILKTIVDKLVNKIDHYAKFLEEILHPDTGLVSMNEASAFNEQDIQQILILYNELNAQTRRQLLIEIDNNENEKIAYFKELFSFWQTKKELLKIFVAKAISVWNIIPAQEANIGYFG